VKHLEAALEVIPLGVISAEVFAMLKADLEKEESGSSTLWFGYTGVIGRTSAPSVRCRVNASQKLYHLSSQALVSTRLIL
jgi:hypothetical protein